MTSLPRRLVDTDAIVARRRLLTGTKTTGLSCLQARKLACDLCARHQAFPRTTQGSRAGMRRQLSCAGLVGCSGGATGGLGTQVRACWATRGRERQWGAMRRRESQAHRRGQHLAASGGRQVARCAAGPRTCHQHCPAASAAQLPRPRRRQGIIHRCRSAAERGTTLIGRPLT
eukprot:scaffold6036_cov371-Prasinococcus_capsulatus_cf.AAC.15